MKTLVKLRIDKEKLINNDQLIQIKGGDWLQYYCCCWSCSGCEPTCGSAWIPEGENPNTWAQQQGSYLNCNCIGGY